VFAAAVRKSDVLARYGGEEFVVLVPQTTEKGLWKVAERIRQQVGSTEICCGTACVPVTISVGIALGIPDRKSVDFGTRLVASSDEAMYEAKQNGRNQVRMRSLLTDHERALAQAILEKRFSRWLVQRGAFDVASVSRALLHYEATRLRIGELAQVHGVLTAPQVEQIRQLQNGTGERFGRVAVQLGFFDDDTLAQLLALQAEDPAKMSKALVAAKLTTPALAATLLEEFRAQHAMTLAPAETQLAGV
jgi:hypothetical protein